MLVIDNKMFLRLRHNIRIFHNILTEYERKLLLEEITPLLYKIQGSFPGLQTNPDLHFLLMQKGIFNLILKIQKKSKISGTISKCWGNYSDETMQYCSWHIHPNTKNTIVYFLENPENLGTICRKNGKEFQIKAPTNSAISLPPSMEHTFPYNITKPRYSLSIDFV